MVDKFDSSSTDAQYWAKSFMEIWQNEPIDVMDEDMMHSWFANAIMAGYDEARRKYEMVNAHETLMRHVLDR
ncbi:hypothetical protein SEA_ANNADREAMY_9 [Streptomyces phage Annadreamy]|uniref:Uncharacterized protein n=2 Tax=Annadreamyvirus annadreamy TaxID=2846392 RepID=A0A345GT61_9CAUD|nr:hypothetical protein HWB75_gp009 [Streptomyces phage Annadreamy]AXG66133.1 hypothetical protein SEA_ANNADREAMY_9 [Streptomyces phage Annadreamy]QGH79345.1 hypothetical protein SEA_LIMPID_9 [Streptomyces phage Limpid]